MKWGLTVWNKIGSYPGAQPRLKSWRGPRFGSQPKAKGRAGCWVREEDAPCRCVCPGYHPRKIFENSDAKSCILVTTMLISGLPCYEISCFLKTTARKLGDQYTSPPVPTVVASTGWLKKVSCCTVSTAYFFEPPCM